MERSVMCKNTSQPVNQVLKHNMFQDYPDIVTHSDLCSMLGISKNTAYDLLKAGQIKYRRIGRIYKIPKQEVIDFISQDLK